MDLSKIGEFLSQGKETEPLLALKIDKGEVKSAFWAIAGEEVITLALGSKEEWGGSKEELLVACDASVSSAITNLPQAVKQTPHRLILGLPSSWVKDNQIIREKLKEIQFVTKKLSFNPLGFVATPEAICFSLKKQKKDFSACVLVYLGSSEITVSLIEEGRVIQTEEVGRSDNLALDVEEGILRFSAATNLPSKILLCNSDDLESARQTLISYPWQPPEEGTRPGFLHLPRVEILPSDFDVESIVIAGGEEIGKAQPSFKEEPEISPPGKEAELPEEPAKGGITFFKGKDVLKEIGEEEEEAEERKTEEIVAEKSAPVLAKEVLLDEEKIPDQKPAEIVVRETSRDSLFRLLTPIKNLLKTAREKLRPPERTKEFLEGKPYFFSKRIYLLGAAVVILFLLAFSFLAKAQVDLTMAQEALSKSFELMADLDQNQLTLEGEPISLETLSVEVAGSKSKPVTGKKTVGEKAKGEVMVYNRTDSPKTFSQGVVILGPGQLKFSLDQEVKVASKTPDLVSGVDRWGEVKAQVTAQEIGAQYNVAAGSQFAFEDFSSSLFLAKNEAAFSGGTSRQISVVSEEDQENLEEELKEELKKKAKDELALELSLSKKPVWEMLKIEVKSRKFDHEVQDEASELNLDLTVKAEVVVFDKKDLLDLALISLASDLKEKPNLQIESEESSITILAKDGENESGKTTLEVEAKIVLRQNLDTQEVKKMIKGRLISSVYKKIERLEGIQSYEIKISPGIFKFFPMMPFLEKNIIVSAGVE